MKKRIEELIERTKRNGSAAVPVPSRCFICALSAEKRQAVDRSLMEKSTSLEAIARDLKIAKSSAWRHMKNHLVPQLKDRLLVAVASRPGVLEGVETPEDLRALNARAELVQLFQKAKALVETTIDNEDFPAVKGFLAEGRQLLELLARLDGKLNGDDPGGSKVPVVVIVSYAPAAAQIAPDDLQVNAPVTIDTRAERV